MSDRYKVIISNKNLYKEIELSSEMKKIKMGTSKDCDIRLYKGFFFEEFELFFIRNDNDWSILCSDNLYINSNSSVKLLTKELVHGDSLEINYQNTDSTVINIEFMIDFDDGKRKYERVIDISNAKQITIGNGSGNNIILSTPYVSSTAIVLTKEGNNSLVLDIKAANYGVYHNGKKAENGERINKKDFISLSDCFFYFNGDKFYAEIRDDITIKGLTYKDICPGNEYPKFTRNARVKTVIDDEKIEILDPPSKPQKPKNNILTRLIPSIITVLISIIVIAAMPMSPFMIVGIVSSLVGIFTTVMTIRENKKDFKANSENRVTKYNNYISEKRNDIEKCREEEKHALEDIYISSEEEQLRIGNFSPDLFDRTRNDDDFLCVRIGAGDVEAKKIIEYKKQERLEIEDDLQTIPETLSEEYKYIKNAPVVCNLKDSNAVAVIGLKENRFEILKKMAIDIATRHYYTDVEMFFVSESVNKEYIQWLRFLPHVYNDVIGIRNIVVDDESKNLIFEYLYKELTIREQNKSFDKNLVVFLFDEYGFKSHPISKFIDKASELGITFIFFGDEKKDVPVGCKYIINAYEKNKGKLTKTDDKSDVSTFTFTSINTALAEKISKKLSPVYTEEVSLESSLVKSFTMFEMLDVLSVDDIDLGRRWSTSQVYKSMSAPIGISKTGMVELDLHDKGHGPHGLVAGTTGSGKSEVLQTYILSMATLFHPYEVGFVIIDFKGGGMVNQLKGLPHLIGAITNIDGKEINRSLKSIKAELQKRQKLFADADVNHIDKYIQKYKTGEVSIPLPHLIVIVDEFAELKAEQPEFMKELISAARIGRSLGVHLILATQKPSGQVNEQIWSNSRFKICLKVQSQEDSNEVLKSPLASEIKEAGRAYLQVGNNEIFELFQSAYSGAPESIENANQKEFTIYELTESGKRVPVYQQKRGKGDESEKTQLDAIVGYVDEYCKENGIEKLPDICLPHLNEMILFDEKSQKISKNITAEIGVYDDPDNQYQGVYSVDLTNSNLMIIGSSQSGKTNVLQDIIRSLSTKYTPSDVNIYIADFASMILKNFDSLNHVGGVVCQREDEKLKNMFKLMYSEIDSRKEKLISAGVSSFLAYKEAGWSDLPFLVLIVDNLTALKELYFQDDDGLLSICREGLSVGISVVIANSQMTGIGYKYLSNFSSKIALYCNDSNEYNSLFEHCGERINNIPGRAIVEIEKNFYENQFYLSFNGNKEFDRVEEIRKYIVRTNQINKNKTAIRIPIIPASLNSKYVLEKYSEYIDSGKYSIVSGVDYETVLPYILDLSSINLLAVSGKKNSGKHNWIKYSIDILDKLYPQRSEIYIVDNIEKNFEEVRDRENVVSYSILANDAVEYVKEIEVKAKSRYDLLAEGNTDDFDESKLVVFIIDNHDALTSICNDTIAFSAYKNLVGRYKQMKVCILALVENVAISYNSPEILKDIREQKNIMFFDDINNMKIFDVPLSILRKYKKTIELGDGYFIRNNDCVKLKTPMNTDDEL